jgi:Sulfotransferase family
MSLLIHIGYHKTGTNWLQRRFFSDPSTGYRWLGKRPGSHPVRRFVRDRPFEFEPDAVRAALRPLIAEAEEAGLLPVLSLERLSGSALSGGYDSVRIADRLHQVFPEGRILVVVREQRSMVVSTYKGYVQQGGAAPLEHFLEGRRSATFRVPGFDPAYFEYDGLIAHYRGLFGPDNVLALAFDQFVEDGRGFVDRIASFAGRRVPAGVLDTLPYGHRENVRTTSALTLSLVRRLNQLAPPTDVNPAPLLESRGAARLAYRLVRRDPLRRRSVGADERLRRAVDEWAGDRFAASNARLSVLLGVDLDRYGWSARPS